MAIPETVTPAPCSLLMLTWNSAPHLRYYASWYRKYFDDFHALDRQSTDGTRELLTELKATIHEDTFKNFAERKNYLTNQARHDWVFHLDSDEAPENSLLNNLVSWIMDGSKERDPLVIAFKFPRINYEARDWPDYQVRLYNRRYCEWRNPVHEIVILKRDGLPVDAERTDSNGHKYKVSHLLQHAIIHDFNWNPKVWAERQERWKQEQAKG